MATMKQLIDTYKSINPSFRHEFDGENWNAWKSINSMDGGYPDIQGISTAKFEEWLKDRLKQYVNEEERKAVQANDNAMSVRKVLNG